MSDQAPPRVPLSIPAIGEGAWRYIKECLDTGWVSSAGPFIKRFEDEICRYTGSPFAVATSCGTAALHLAYLVAGIGPKSTVLVPSLSFVATANAVTYLGAKPWFVDSDPATWNVSKETVVAALGAARKAGQSPSHLVVTHLYGVPAPMEELVGLCQAEGLILVEDAAESLGTRYQDRHTGLFGRAAALSFNGNKIITTGGGGMVLTGDDGLARRARHLSTQARTDPRYYFHDEVGFNYRLTNLHAALGVSQLEDLPRLRERRRAIQQNYAKALSSIEWLRPQAAPMGSETNGWLYSVRVTERAPMNRDALLAELDRRGIEARPVFEPIQQLAPFKGAAGECPVAKLLALQALSLPNSPQSDELRVIETLQAVARAS